jgi:phosphonatase-like hydrolase
MSNSIELVAFDVAGTTVSDDGLVIKSFQLAFQKAEPELWDYKAEEMTQYAIDTMGQSKIEVFTALLGSAERATRAVVAFEDAYYEIVSRQGISAIAGAEAVINSLRKDGVKVALTTGFSRKTLDLIIEKLGWREILDFTVTPQEAGAGRPSPLMLEACGEAVGVTAPLSVIAVGDTISDMESGIAYGASQIIGVLTGTHDEVQLRKAGATSVIHSVADFKTSI